jgi:hypothetical protein
MTITTDNIGILARDVSRASGLRSNLEAFEICDTSLPKSTCYELMVIFQVSSKRRFGTRGAEFVRAVGPR